MPRGAAIRSSRSGLETPVQLANASLGVLLGQLLGLLQCKEPNRVGVERNERKQPRWALIRELRNPRYRAASTRWLGGHALSCRRQGRDCRGLLRRQSRLARYIDGSQGQRRDIYQGRSDCRPRFRLA